MSPDRKPIVAKYGSTPNDTGSTEVQIALLTTRIGELTEHLRTHQSDNSCRRGLLTLVNRRRRLLKYLHREDPAKYNSVSESLNLRRQL